MPYSLPSLPNDAFCLEEPRIQYLFLELPNCGRALSPQATILDNFCFSLHNSARRNSDMTTERDIRNQIRFAEKQAAAKAAAKAEAKATERTRKEDSIKTARLMLAKNYPISEIADISGLTEEQIRAL